MAPELFYSAGPKDKRWGKGMEQFKFIGVPQDAGDWYRKTARLPLIVKDSDLAEVPDSALAMLRNIMSSQLMEGLAVSKEGEDWVGETGEALLQMVPDIITVGNLKYENWDRGRTENIIIPLHTDKGDIEIVANSAWGFGWRLDEDHLLVGKYPQLKIVQNEDLTVPSKDEELKRWSQSYLAPDVLARVSENKIPIKVIVAEVHSFLVDMFTKEGEDIVIDRGGSSTGDSAGGDGGFGQLRFRNERERVVMSLRIGNSSGIKRLDFLGYQERQGQELTGLGEMANSINSKLRRIHNVTKE